MVCERNCWADFLSPLASAASAAFSKRSFSRFKPPARRPIKALLASSYAFSWLPILLPNSAIILNVFAKDASLSTACHNPLLGSIRIPPLRMAWLAILSECSACSASTSGRRSPSSLRIALLKFLLSLLSTAAPL